MGVIQIARVRAARQARNLAEAMSSDPSVRARARTRAIAEINRREQRLKQPRQLAEVVVLPTARFRRLAGEDY
jgi:alcohol dehydrogenase class IV